MKKRAVEELMEKHKDDMKNLASDLVDFTFDKLDSIFNRHDSDMVRTDMIINLVFSAHMNAVFTLINGFSNCTDNKKLQQDVQFLIDQLTKFLENVDIPKCNEIN